MTLVVGVVQPDGGVWMGGDRFTGEFDHNEIATPKIFQLSTEDEIPFLVGFAGSARVAQAILAVYAGPRAPRSLHWWLTDYCDRIRAAVVDRALLCDPHDGDEPHLAGHTAFVLGIDGHVLLIDRRLAWEEPTRGWQANGGAYETFNGAYEVLRAEHKNPVDAARRAWPYVARHHRIGPLADELTIPARSAP